MSPRAQAFMAVSLALLSVPALAQTAPASDPALDVGRDQRLSRRIMLRSEGMYVSHVLRRLSAKSGVPLSVSGRSGDERLIAFVPEEPLAEVLASIADLYNLKWGRETKDGKVSYQLFKPLARVREEALLKERALQNSLVELDRQANEPPKKQGDPGGHHAELRAAALATVRANWTAITSQRRKRICVSQVTPGIDFRHLSGGDSQIDRLNGAFYKSLWGTANDCGADWVLIDSFNQWEIGTEIEPSREFGDFYLKLTAEQAALFKAKK